MKFLFLLMILSACSSQKTSSSYMKLHADHLPRHQACIQHRDQILLKPVTESEVADLDDEQYYFIRNEASALPFIENFDVSKFTLKENQLEYQAIVDSCAVEKDPNHKPCDTLYPAFKYFRALIHGMNQYQWSASTIEKSTKNILSYLKYAGASESSLMDILFANDLLTRLANRGYVKKEIAPQSIQLRKTAEKTYRDLMSQLKKFGKRELTCQEAKDFYAQERLKVKELSKQFLEILNQVS